MAIDTKTFIQSQLNELDSILSFWMNRTIDNESGGFIGSMNSNGETVAGASKGAVLNTRILWTFSAAFNFSGNPEYLTMANRAYDYVTTHFIDKVNGGVFWELDAKGNPLNRRKQAYALGFAIYGLSEYYRASNVEQSLFLAQELFWTLEKYFFDKKYDGYIEALAENWKPLADMRLSEKDANEPKSMNTHLHILEPYTNLYRVWKNPVLAESIRRVIRVFLDKIINRETAHFQLFFDYDWTVKSTAVSYGHDIEGAWLLTEAAEVLGDVELRHEVEAMALRMTDVTLAEGADADGSIYNERDGDHLDTDKHWWPQAEAMVGYTNAWQICGSERYMNEAAKVWDFIREKIVDQERGEWFWRVDGSGKPYSTDEKTGFWKCPYHNTRAIIECVTRWRKYDSN